MNFQIILDALAELLTVKMLLLMLFGVTFGIIAGAIPGFSTQLAMIVMIPYSYKLPTLEAAVFLSVIVIGGNFGGSISSILLNIPGTPQAIGATFDGYPMSRKGMANEAMGAALGASTFGSLFGGIALLFLLVPMSKLALKFGPAEMFLAVLIGITMIASLSEGMFVKGMLVGCFGLILGCVGMSASANIRGSLGFYELADGIPILPMLLGCMGLPEIFSMASIGKVVEQEDFKPNLRRILQGVKQGFCTWKYSIYATVIGIIVGILPGAGAMFATVVSYNECRKITKDKENFGKGDIRGVIAAEAADSASQGGSWALVMALGVPGGTSAAILYGALVVKGIVLGPRFLTDYIGTGYSITLALIISTLILLVIGVVICFMFSGVITIPANILAPVLLVFTAVGAYAERGYVFDVLLMVVFGIISYCMREHNYPTMAMILGIILGSMAETYLIRAKQVYDTVWQLFDRPQFIILFIFTLSSVFLPIFRLLKETVIRKEKKETI